MYEKFGGRAMPSSIPHCKWRRLSIILFVEAHSHPSVEAYGQTLWTCHGATTGRNNTLFDSLFGTLRLSWPGTSTVLSGNEWFYRPADTNLQFDMRLPR